MSIFEKGFRSNAKAVSSWRDLDAAAREDCVRKDLTRRLQGSCENLSNADFEDLIGKMTSEQLRGERRAGRRIDPS